MVEPSGGAPDPPGPEWGVRLFGAAFLVLWAQVGVYGAGARLWAFGSTRLAQEQEFEGEDEESKGVGIDPLELVRFVAECGRRHLWLAISVFLVVSVPGVWLSRMIPLEFQTQSQIVVNPEGIRSRVLANGPSPFRGQELIGVSDKFFRAENIRSIVIDSDLERLWMERRPTLLAWKDKVRGDIRRLKPEQRVRALMGTVNGRLSIAADQTGVVTIGATWTDPDTAYRLAEVAKRRFLEERLDEEVAVFKEVLSILEDREKSAARDVEKALARVEQVGWKRPEPAPKAPAPSSGETLTPKVIVSTVREEGTVDPQTVVRLEKVRQDIRALFDPWQRRLGELKVQLSDLSSHYGPKHPLVVNQENRIQEAQTPPPGLEELRAEEAKLMAAIEQMSRPSEKIVRRTDGSSSSKDSGPGPAAPQGPVRVDSAELSAEQSKLMTAISTYNELNERIDRTRIEISTAETSFKYRYQITQEPEVPATPLKPKLPMMIALGALVFGALLGLLSGPIVELLSGKMLAPWQAKVLGIPVLAELRLVEDEPVAS